MLSYIKNLKILINATTMTDRQVWLELVETIVSLLQMLQSDWLYTTHSPMDNRY